MGECIRPGSADLFDLPDNTEVLAHWHGQWRTDAFRLTVGELKRMPVDGAVK